MKKQFIWCICFVFTVVMIASAQANEAAQTTDESAAITAASGLQDDDFAGIDKSEDTGKKKPKAAKKNKRAKKNNKKPVKQPKKEKK